MPIRDNAFKGRSPGGNLDILVPVKGSLKGLLEVSVSFWCILVSCTPFLNLCAV